MSYTHLTENDRYVISHLHGSGISIREIGRRLGRAHTTITREVARNGSALTLLVLLLLPLLNAKVVT